MNRYLILYYIQKHPRQGTEEIPCEFFVNFRQLHRKRGPEMGFGPWQSYGKEKTVRDEFGKVHNLFILRDFITGYT